MEIILNIIVIIMLGFTISYCLRLNKKIMELKDSRKDLIELVRTFDTTMINTHKSIANLKEVSANAANDLRDGISKAEELANDLAFMNDTSEKIADRLEKSIEIARSASSQVSLLQELVSTFQEIEKKMIENIKQIEELQITQKAQEIQLIKVMKGTRSKSIEKIQNKIKSPKKISTSSKVNINKTAKNSEILEK